MTKPNALLEVQGVSRSFGGLRRTELRYLQSLLFLRLLPFLDRSRGGQTFLRCQAMSATRHPNLCIGNPWRHDGCGTYLLHHLSPYL